MKFLLRSLHFSGLAMRLLAFSAALLALSAAVSYAAGGDRTGPRGTVPNPGTQQQELGNITVPAPYNVFEFVVTCGACHGGAIDQQAGHFGNWAGSNMASSARDPVFRANAIGVEMAVQGLTGEEGASNMCFRCHSPNGWLSGRFDPNLAGAADGSTMIHSILASTDDEGINCETCHRAIGNVVMQRDGVNPHDPAWNMLAGLSDWPHQGLAYPNGPRPGDPLGDGTLQFNDGMTYAGKYTGSVEIYSSDLPIKIEGANTANPVYTYIDGSSNYAGQTYGVYPPGYTGTKAPVPAGKLKFNSANQEIVYNPDGSVPLHFEVPIPPPTKTNLIDPDYQSQAISLEHPTTDGDFIRSPEFCGTCHDLTVPVLNHGMPEQRTYSEWKYSDFGAFGDKTASTYKTCQTCHSPTMKHEYADDAAVSLNADPSLVGWQPYGKDRNPNGGTTFHKNAGANRDLPMMMKVLYPEVDLEVIGAPTGRDTRVFPGMMSSRDLTWDRTIRNTEISMRDAVEVQISSGPTYNADTGKWEVKVKVINETGHRIPSGYPDGRRFWINLQVKNAGGSVVYESGYYDEASAELYTNSAKQPLTRALGPVIDSASNAVMIYEKVTGNCTATGCTPSPSLLNGSILFDNRIPPKGFKYADYQAAGTKFWSYDPTNFAPFEDTTRYPDGQNWDEITYTFTAPEDAALSVRAEVYWQTHTREFMEHLRIQDISTVRPEGPPSIYEPNYPLVPNYLSDRVVDYVNEQTSLPDIQNFTSLKSLGGEPLKDNWGGIAYAAWLLTDKGAPFLAAADDTADVVAPPAPATITATPVDPFAIEVKWDAVAEADGYTLWIRYGTDESTEYGDLGLTASWDRLAVIYPEGGETQFSFINDGLNVGKTYQYRVDAFNGKGYGRSVVAKATTIDDLPLAPESLRVVNALPNAVTLAWYDLADNEVGFIIERQEVIPGKPLLPFTEISRVGTPNGGGVGGVSWTDNTVKGGKTYNYQVRTYNEFGISLPSLPVQAATGGAPGGVLALASAILPGPSVSLVWSGATGSITGYRIERSSTGLTGPWDATFTVTDGAAGSFIDPNAQPNTTYYYRVFAYNNAGDSDPSNTLTVVVPPPPPAAPSNLRLNMPQPNIPIAIRWTDNARAPNNEQNFIIERAIEPVDGTPLNFVEIARVGANVVRYSDGLVEPKTTYVYRVIAFRTNTGPSLPSNELRVTTPGEIPEPPTLLKVASVTRNSIRLTWTDTAVNELGFYLERSTDGVNWVRAFTIAANAKAYTDNTLNRTTTYYYRIQAYNRQGTSAFSDVVSAKTR